MIIIVLLRISSRPWQRCGMNNLHSDLRNEPLLSPVCAGTSAVTLLGFLNPTPWLLLLYPFPHRLHLWDLRSVSPLSMDAHPNLPSSSARCPGVSFGTWLVSAGTASFLPLPLEGDYPFSTGSVSHSRLYVQNLSHWKE